MSTKDYKTVVPADCGACIHKGVCIMFKKDCPKDYKCQSFLDERTFAFLEANSEAKH